MEQNSLLSVGRRNYQAAGGWRQAVITPGEEHVIQDAAREANRNVFAESMEDARELLKDGAVPGIYTPDNVLAVARFLAERRIPHVVRLFEEYLSAKVDLERKREAVAAELSGEGYA